MKWLSETMKQTKISTIYHRWKWENTIEISWKSYVRNWYNWSKPL